MWDVTKVERADFFKKLYSDLGQGPANTIIKKIGRCRDVLGHDIGFSGNIPCKDRLEIYENAVWTPD